MDANRIETTPACLAALAAVALGLSCLTIYPRQEVDYRPRCNSKAETRSRPLQWPSLALSQIPIEAPLEVTTREGLRGMSLTLLSPFVVEPPRISSLVQDDWSLLLDLPKVGDDWSSATLDPIEKELRQSPGLSEADDSFAGLVFLLPARPKMTAARPTLAKTDSEHFDFSDKTYSHNASFLEMPVREMARRAMREAINAKQTTSILVGQQKVTGNSKPVRLPPCEPLEQTPILKPTVSEPLLTDYLLAEEEYGVMPTPVSLTKQLSRLAEYDSTCAWAWSTAYRLRGLASATDVDAIARAIAALNSLVQQAEKMLDEGEERHVEVELSRAKHALKRRIDTWSVVISRESGFDNNALPNQPREDLLANARWALSSDAWAIAPSLTARTAQRISTPPVKVIHEIEKYEESPSNAKAREIVRQLKQFSSEKNPVSTDLTQAVEQHYRNANFRVAISPDLVNRLLPASKPKVQRVSDRIAGAPVQGRSSTDTKLKVRVIPDPNSLLIGLEARGVVSSRTVSRGGPAKLQSKGATKFVANKQVQVTNQGVTTSKTKAQAQNKTQLVGLSTEYDRMPLIGSYVRTKARSEYQRRRGRASSEVEKKISQQIVDAVNKQTEEGITRLENRYQEAVLDRAKNLGIDVTPIDMRTTDLRWIARFRISGQDQLGAHTPRMRAPSDSLISMQLHESALNNMLEGVGLDGKRMSTNELREHFVETLALEQIEEDFGEKATLHFAEEDAVHVALEEGRMKLTLSLREIVVRGKRHQNFKVHVFYRPEVLGSKALLVQEGTPQIEGRMRTAKRLQLHGALGKVLGEDRRIVLVKSPAELAPKHAERLVGLAPTQFVIEDGWLGLAIGPKRTKYMAMRVGTYVR